MHNLLKTNILSVIFMTMCAISAELVPVTAPEGLTILRLPSIWKFSMVSVLGGPAPNLVEPPPAAREALSQAVASQVDDTTWADYQDNTGAGWESRVPPIPSAWACCASGFSCRS